MDDYNICYKLVNTLASQPVAKQNCTDDWPSSALAVFRTSQEYWNFVDFLYT